MLKGMYKPGIFWIKKAGEYLLEQNPETGSVFAQAARKGRKIQWVIKNKPVPGHLEYTGEVIIDGKRMTKEQAKEML